MQSNLFPLTPSDSTEALQTLKTVYCQNLQELKDGKRHLVNVLYCYSDSKCQYCKLVLGERHFEYNMSRYRKEILCISDAKSLYLINIAETEFSWEFKVVPITGILVDSSETLIPLGSKGDSFLKLNDDEVSKVKEVVHYTDFKGAKGILSKGGFYLKSLSRYGTEKSFSPYCRFSNTVFGASFFQCGADYSDMETKFKVKVKTLYRLHFSYKNNLSCAFEDNKPLGCYDNSGLVGYIKRKSGWLASAENKLLNEKVYADIRFKKIDYQNKEINTATKYCPDEGQMYADVYSIGKSVATKYSYQSEIRVQLILNSMYKVLLPEFHKIFLPFDWNEILQIEVVQCRQPNEGQRNILFNLANIHPEIKVR